MLPGNHRSYPWIVAAATVVMVVRLLLTLQFNHTFDEGFHIASGMSVMLNGQQTADVTHPPLAWMGTGLMLKLSGVEVPAFHGNTQGLNFDDSAWLGQQILFHQDPQDLSYWSILTRARLPMLIWPVMGIFVIYRLGRYLFNGRTAMLTCLLLSTDPLLLGHGLLVNNDVPVMVMFAASFLSMLRFIARPNWKRAMLAGAIFGLAMGTKFTALLLLPILIACLALRAIWKYPLRRRHGLGPVKSLWAGMPRITRLAGSACAGLGVLWAVYFFQVGHLSAQNQFDYTPKFQSAVQKIHDPLVPTPSLLTGMAFQISHSSKGHANMFQGQINLIGSHLYFPTLLLMKLPIATLATIGLGVGIWAIRRKHWQLMALLAVPVGLYLYVSITGKVTIGLRHLMPILPLMILLGMAGLQRAGRGVIPLLLVGIVFVETAAAHPNYLGYFNVAVGGPDQASRVVADSNIDWGQDFQTLADWLEQNNKHLDSARLWNKCPQDLLKEVNIDPGILDLPPHGLFAISRLTKAGIDSVVVDEKTGKVTDYTDYSWLAGYPRIATIGTSIEVYDLGDQPVPAYHQSPIKGDPQPNPSPRFRTPPATTQP